MRMIVSVILIVNCVQGALAVAPTLSAITASPVGDNWAQITWTTNQNATTYVDYGPTTSYGTTVSDANSYTKHRITLFGLTPSTTYHYRVRSTNTSSETGTSGDYTFTTGTNLYGCESNPTGEPLGGGLGYSRIINSSSANYVVSTTSAFRSALTAATSGQIIYVADDAMIDLSGYNNMTIPAGVTIASGRGNNGSVGGLLYTNTFTSAASTPLFRSGGAGVRITGLRLGGPHNGWGRTGPMYHGIYADDYWMEIDNCEFYGFNYAGIETTPGTQGLYVHHCYFHHITRNGVGYPVCPSQGVALIEGNLFDYYRHAIASSGAPVSSYESRYNLIMEHAINHTMDMHGGADRGDGTDIAGNVIRIHHNTVRNLDQSAVVIRGIPVVGCWVNNNWFLREYSSYVVRQTNATGNMTVADNLFGPVTATSTLPPDPAAGVMLGKWLFNEGSGSTTADGSGHGYTGTLTNMDTAACWVSGHGGTGLHFDGVDDFVDCGAGPAQTDNFAIDLWVKFDELVDNQVIVSNGVIDIFNRGASAANRPFFRIRTNEGVGGGDSWWSGYSAARSTISMTTGAWYHIAATRAGSKMRLFINGTFDREVDGMLDRTVNNTGRTNFKIGSVIKGSVDDVQIFTPNDQVGNNAPTLTWTGEANFTGDAVDPDTGSMSNAYTFRVKYSDPDGDAPMAGYPKLHLLRNGTEFTYFTPLTMMPADSGAFTSGRIYQCKLRLPRGSDYSYYFEAYDVLETAATGAATGAKAGPAITSGNSTPVLFFARNSTNYVQDLAYPYQNNTSNATYDFRGAYMDIDNDPPQAGYPKLKVMIGTTEIAGSPFTMTQMDTTEFCEGRHYQLIKRFPAGTYKTQIIANDAQGTAAVLLPMSADTQIVSDAGTAWTDLFTSAANPNPSMSFQVAVSFGVSVTGFTASDVSVTNGSVSGFTGSGGFYSFTVTAATEGTVTVSVPAGVTSPGNNASTSISRVCYPATGAAHIWIGHGYTSAHLGTQSDPFDLITEGIGWLASGGTMHILTGSNPETIRVTKPMRIESSGGTARIGGS